MTLPVGNDKNPALIRLQDQKPVTRDASDNDRLPPGTPDRGPATADISRANERLALEGAPTAASRIESSDQARSRVEALRQLLSEDPQRGLAAHARANYSSVIAALNG